MKSLLALLCAVWFSFCLHAQSPEPVQLFAHSAYEIMAEGYAQTGLKPPTKEPGYVDAVYVLLPRELINEMDFAVTPKQHLNFVSEANDCDDIAKEWCVLTHLWWLEFSQGKAPVALSTFVVYVDIEAGAFDGRFMFTGGHALGLLCDAEGVWWFVEPRAHWAVKAQEAIFEGNITTRQIIW